MPSIFLYKVLLHFYLFRYSLLYCIFICPLYYDSPSSQSFLLIRDSSSTPSILLIINLTVLSTLLYLLCCEYIPYVTTLLFSQFFYSPSTDYTARESKHF